MSRSRPGSTRARAAFGENGEEVERGGSGKGTGLAPGTQAEIVAASCCAKRWTRPTSGPGHRLQWYCFVKFHFPIVSC